MKNQNLTLPNILTSLRIVLVPVFLISVLEQKLTLAIIIFSFCTVSDFLDGHIARQRGQRTKLGAFLDPLADKFLLLSSFILLAALNYLPLWMPIVIITKDLIVFIGWWLRLHIIGKSEVAPTFLGKTTTFLEMAVILLVLIGIPENIFHIAKFIMLIAIIISSFDYIVSGITEIETK